MSTPVSVMSDVREYLAVHSDVRSTGYELDDMAKEISMLVSSRIEHLELAASYALAVLESDRGKQAKLRAIDRLKAALKVPRALAQRERARSRRRAAPSAKAHGRVHPD